MLESQFIKQNKDKWNNLEHQLLKGKTTEPEQLAEYFVHITEDLSYARTYYPNRQIRVYLNDVAQITFQSIYKNRKTKWKLFTDFWKYELPSIVYSCRLEFMIAFTIFIVSIGIGVLSSHSDPAFPKSILGESYINMTISNINKEDPMAVYKSSKAMPMFLGITLNNLKVAFMTFVLGVFMGLGTIMFLINNGIMVGTFQHFFVSRDLFRESFLAIWLHGTLEISSIVIAGAAGLVLGSGLLFPGTYSRFQSFKLSTRKGLKIMLGTVPIFIVAALIESFLTRHTGISDVLRGMFILLSFAFILIYFVYYPWIVSKKPEYKFYMKPEKIETYHSSSTNNYGIRTVGDVLSGVMDLYGKYFGKMIIAFISIAIVISLIWAFSMSESDFNSITIFSRNTIYQNLVLLFNFENSIPHYLITSLVVAFAFSFVHQLYENATRTYVQKAMDFLNVSIIFLLLNYVIMESTTVLFSFYILLAPFMVLWAVITVSKKTNLAASLATTIKYSFSDLPMTSGINFISVLLGLFILLLLSSPLLLIYSEFISWNFVVEENDARFYVGIFFCIMSIFTSLLTFSFTFLSIHFLYENLKEINEGDTLKNKIMNIQLPTRH